MKIYAIYDVMIAYYLHYFMEGNHKQAKSRISETINTPGHSSIQKTPHHFEIHHLGEINDETGQVTGYAGQNTILCNCRELVRTDVREEPEPGTPPVQQAAKRSTDPYNRSGERASGNHSLPAKAAQAEPGSTQSARTRPG
jgi:hypothetical protein